MELFREHKAFGNSFSSIFIKTIGAQGRQNQPMHIVPIDSMACVYVLDITRWGDVIFFL